MADFGKLRPPVDSHPFYLWMAVIVMVLAIAAVPGEGRALFLIPIGCGAALAIWRIRQA